MGAGVCVIHNIPYLFTSYSPSLGIFSSPFCQATFSTELKHLTLLLLFQEFSQIFSVSHPTPPHILYTIHSTHPNILLLKIFLICKLIFSLSYFPKLHIFSYSILHHQKTIYSPPGWDHGFSFTSKSPVPKLVSVHSDFSSNTV